MKIKKLLPLLAVLGVSAYAGGDSDLYGMKGGDCPGCHSGYVGLGVGWHKHRHDVTMHEYDTNKVKKTTVVHTGNKKLNKDSSVWGWTFFLGDYLYHDADGGVALEVGSLVPGKKNVSGTVRVSDGTNHTDFNFSLKREAEGYLALRPVFDMHGWDFHVLAGVVGTVFNSTAYPSTVTGTTSWAAGVNGANYDGRFKFGWLLGLGVSSALDCNWSVRFDYDYTKYSKVELHQLNGAAYAVAADGYGSTVDNKGNHHFNLSVVSNFGWFS